jgi:RNA polymerase sigma-70 factor (ECF subfamily)
MTRLPTRAFFDLLCSAVTVESNSKRLLSQKMTTNLGSVGPLEVFMKLCGLKEEINVYSIISSATDEALVEEAKSGDHAAFAKLWERHSKRAFNAAYRIMRSQDDAEDVIQDAWMKAYVHLKTFDGRAKFSTWLIRIVINSGLMTLRRRRARHESSMEFTDSETWQDWEIPDRTKNVEELYARHEGTEHLRRAIHRLRPALRNVIDLSIK